MDFLATHSIPDDLTLTFGRKRSWAKWKKIKRIPKKQSMNRDSFATQTMHFPVFFWVRKELLQQHNRIWSSVCYKLALQIPITNPELISQTITRSMHSSQSGVNPLSRAWNKTTFAIQEGAWNTTVRKCRNRFVSKTCIIFYPHERENLKIVVSKRRLLPPFEESQKWETIYCMQGDPEAVEDWSVPFVEALQNGRLPEEPVREMKLGEEWPNSWFWMVYYVGDRLMACCSDASQETKYNRLRMRCMLEYAALTKLAKSSRCKWKEWGIIGQLWCQIV